MKNKKILLLSVAFLSLASLVACGGGSNTSTPATSEPTYVDDLTQRVELKMSVQYQDSETRMTFGDKNVPYTDIEGNVYNQGALKPVWEAVSDNLNIGIQDVTPTDKVADSFKKWQTDGFDKVDVLQGTAANIQDEGILNGTILDLNEYLDRLPNFKAFLDGNKVVRSTITTSEGNIFYAPYFDGYDDAEKMMLMRTDWVEKLLDGSGTLDTGVEITTSYKAYMPDSLDTTVSVLRNGEKATLNKKYGSGKGIIARMDGLSVKNGQTLTECLRTYISETYGNQYDKLSDLFIGEDAAYDADEYVALLRCVKTNPGYLTGDATKVIVPFFPRESKNSRTADMFSMMGQLFGIRGLSSKSGFLYINSNGEVKDARWENETVEALDRMHQMYEEGLILADFTNKGATGGTKGDFFTQLHGDNKGFSSFDYVQTQTAHNRTYGDPIKEAGQTFNFTVVIPAVARWNGSSEYTRFQESWRSVKTEGWCISAELAKPGNEAKLARALTLLDYFWGEEGNRLMSYGPDQYLAKNEDGTIATIEYKGAQVPKLHPQTVEQLKTIAKYNYTNYYRKWLGGTFPIGYVKEQGMEYQCNVEEGRLGLDVFSKALVEGVIEHPDVTWTNEDKWYWICPTTFAYDSVDADAVANNFPKLDDITNDSSSNNIWSKYVMHGFGATTTTETLLTKEEYVEYYKTTANGEGYVYIFNSAFENMI